MCSNKAYAKPLELSNSEIVKHVCRAIHPLALLRYEAISDFYTEEPTCIHVKLTEKSGFDSFEQILRMRIWIPNHITFAWCIYSQDRGWHQEDEHIGGLIIRHVIWERHADLGKLKTCIGNLQNGYLNNWPTIKAKNIYLAPENTLNLIEHFKQLDNVISTGIKLNKRRRKKSSPLWDNFEIMRLFDWGQVHNTWSPEIVNEYVENYADFLDKKLRNCLEKQGTNIYQMDLDYTCPPEVKKSLIEGSLL